MMSHPSDDRFSQWLDRELDPIQTAQIEEHLKGCEACRAIEMEMSGADRIFRDAEALGPSPYLWTRIAAQLDEESRQEKRNYFGLGWLAGAPQLQEGSAWAKAVRWAPAALLLVIIASTLTFMEYRATARAELAALAEIDRAHGTLLAANTKTFNPFHEASAADTGMNPFAQSRLKDQPNPFRTPPDRP
jgi:predicted anti-sigma-YlaC factor YlaD